MKRLRKKWEQFQGDVQPFSSYKTKGHDVDKFDLKRLASEWNTGLQCMTYRINIHGAGQKNVEELARTEC